MLEDLKRKFDCEHTNFKADVNVNRLTDVKCFTADITITCEDCGSPFYFLGVQPGLFNERPSTSPDGTELRAPIAPGVKAIIPGSYTFEVPRKRDGKDSV